MPLAAAFFLIAPLAGMRVNAAVGGSSRGGCARGGSGTRVAYVVTGQPVGADAKFLDLVV